MIRYFLTIICWTLINMIRLLIEWLNLYSQKISVKSEWFRSSFFFWRSNERISVVCVSHWWISSSLVQKNKSFSKTIFSRLEKIHSYHIWLLIKLFIFFLNSFSKAVRSSEIQNLSQTRQLLSHFTSLFQSVMNDVSLNETIEVKCKVDKQILFFSRNENKYQID